jgi:hypothetical protein
MLDVETASAVPHPANMMIFPNYVSNRTFVQQ